jgi:hypothetical protein
MSWRFIIWRIVEEFTPSLRLERRGDILALLIKSISGRLTFSTVISKDRPLNVERCPEESDCGWLVFGPTRILVGCMQFAMLFQAVFYREEVYIPPYRRRFQQESGVDWLREGF